MSLISLVKKVHFKANLMPTELVQAIEGTTRVTFQYGHLDVYRADRHMLCVAAREVLLFDLVSASEVRACNTIIAELGVVDARFIYSRPEILFHTTKANRVDNKETYDKWVSSRSL